MKKINFTFSLDYELAWGVFDKLGKSYLLSNVARANTAAREILDINNRDNFPTTWAVVGVALDKSITTDKKILLVDSDFTKDASAFEFLSGISEVDLESLLNIPDGFIKDLDSSPHQELASHTFSHFYSLDVDDSLVERDFERMNEVYDFLGVNRPVSLVLPKNLATRKVIDKAVSFGIKVVRKNPNTWLYAPRKHGSFERRIIRVLRYLDSFFPVGEFFSRKESDDAVCVTEGNFFFRPSFASAVLDRLHFFRFKLFVYGCMFTGRDVHIWSHPHNFGGDVGRSIGNYKRMVDFVKNMESSGRLDLKTMGELCE